MTLNDLIQLADKHYPDGKVAECWDFRNENLSPRAKAAGDTLALFIVLELADTFDEDADDEIQCRQAAAAIDTAIRELTALRDGLYN